MRRLSCSIEKYGPDAGPKLYHAHQSQAAHAGVSARRKRKIERLLDRRYQSFAFLESLAATAVLDPE